MVLSFDLVFIIAIVLSPIYLITSLIIPQILTKCEILTFVNHANIAILCFCKKKLKFQTNF